jgi:hypothetical protein
MVLRRGNDHGFFFVLGGAISASGGVCSHAEHRKRLARLATEYTDGAGIQLAVRA